MKPKLAKSTQEVAITVDEYGCLVIDGKIKISEEAQKWIGVHWGKGRHISVSAAFFGSGTDTQQLRFADVSANKLMRRLGPYVTNKTLKEMIRKDPLMDDFPDYT